MAQTPQKTAPPENEEAHTPGEVTEMFRILMNTMATKEDLKQFATKDDLNRFATKEDLNRFATKDDVKQMIAEAKHELKDHTTRECAKVRGDLTAIAHRQDEKANEFIRTAAKSEAISRADAGRLHAINPFLVPAD